MPTLQRPWNVQIYFENKNSKSISTNPINNKYLSKSYTVSHDRSCSFLEWKLQIINSINQINKNFRIAPFFLRGSYKRMYSKRLSDLERKKTFVKTEKFGGKLIIRRKGDGSRVITRSKSSVESRDVEVWSSFRCP